MAKLCGDTFKYSEKTKFSGNTNETQLLNRSLYLHRMDFALSRPDEYGSWNINLKLLFPYVKTHRQEAVGTGSGGGGVVIKPKDKYRGGWQLVLMREIKL